MKRNLHLLLFLIPVFSFSQFRLIKDISPGSGSSYITDIITYNGSLIFSAYDPIQGQELWISDATESGTFIIKDIRSGAASSLPTNLVTYNGLVYFIANDGVHGKELWVTDGT